MERSLKKNFIFNTILKGTAYLLPFLLTPYVSRILLPEGTGRISFANSLITYLCMISMLGIPTYGVRACAGVREDREKLSQTAGELLALTLVMSAVSYAALFVLILFVPQFAADRSLILVMSLMILLNVLNMEWLYSALEEAPVFARRSLIIRLLMFSLVFVFVKSREDVLIYGLLLSLLTYGAGLWNFFGTRRYIDWKPKRRLHLGHHAKASMVFFAVTVTTTIYVNLDVVMLGLLAGNAETGYYDAGVKVKNLLMSVVTSFGVIMLPRVCSYVAEKRMKDFEQLCRRAFNIVFIMAVPLLVYFMIFTPDLVAVLYGRDYAPAVLPLRILLPTTILIGMSNVAGIQMLVPLGQEKWTFYATLAGAVTDFIINLLLIPKYGACGAAIGTLAAEVVVDVIEFYAIRKYLGGMFGYVSFLRILAAAGIAGAGASLTWIIKTGSLVRLVVSLCVFGLLYGGALALLGEKEVRTQLRSVMKRLQR